LRRGYIEIEENNIVLKRNIETIPLQIQKSFENIYRIVIENALNEVIPRVKSLLEFSLKSIKFAK